MSDLHPSLEPPASFQKPQTSRWRMIITVITFLALGILVYALRDEIGEVINNLGKVNTFALLLMIPLQVINYHSYVRMYQRLLTILHRSHIRYRHLYRVQLELNFVNSVFPSGGVSGISYFNLRMKAFGVSPSQATMVQVMKFALLFISFQALLFIGLFALAIMGRASNLTILVGGSLATLVMVGTLIGGYILDSKTRIRSSLTLITKLINWLIQRVRTKHPETINIGKAQKAFEELHDNYQMLKSNWRSLKRPLILALLANVTEILTIYVVYVAFGEFVNIGAVILAYAIANFAGFISVLPGGIGIYEGLMTAVMATTGVSPALSIPVIIMYRVLNMIIQLPLGYWFYNNAIQSNGFSYNERK